MLTLLNLETLAGLAVAAPALIPMLVSTCILYKLTKPGEMGCDLRPEQFVPIVLFAIVLPPALITWSTSAFPSAYSTEKGAHWIGYLNEWPAGATTLPIIYAAALLSVFAVLPGRYDMTTWLHLTAIWTLAAVCAWYAYAIYHFGLTDDPFLGNCRILYVVPVVACFNYSLLGFVVWRFDSIPTGRLRWLVVWFGALAASVLVKIPLAISFQKSLPDMPPHGYGDCFVVSAAAKGHPWFVRSWVAKGSGRVNGQLVRLRDFEALLKRRVPCVHEWLRSAYNVLGPAVARRIRYRVQADVVYLLLKPVEAVAWVLLRVDGRGEP